MVPKKFLGKIQSTEAMYGNPSLIKRGYKATDFFSEPSTISKTYGWDVCRRFTPVAKILQGHEAICPWNWGSKLFPCSTHILHQASIDSEFLPFPCWICLKCLEHVKNRLPNGGLISWFTMVESAKKSPTKQIETWHTKHPCIDSCWIFPPFPDIFSYIENHCHTVGWFPQQPTPNLEMTSEETSELWNTTLISTLENIGGQLRAADDVFFWWTTVVGFTSQKKNKRLDTPKGWFGKGGPL